MAPPDERACYPASANQKRMYVLNQLWPHATEYNVPVALRLEGELDIDRLRDALSALLTRHASLRTSFKIDGDEVVQTIDKRACVRLPRRRAESKADVEKVRKSFVRPFDLRRAPLFRACLVRLERTQHVLLLDMHHIICDGVSVDILLEDLGRLYDGQTLKEQPGEYKDFALWQRGFAETAEARKQEEYWLGLLGCDRPASSLPTDYPRQHDQSFDGDRVFTPLGRDLCAELRSLVARNRVSMYMVLLAAYYVLLSRYTGEEDVIVGTLVTGRQDEKFRDVVGLFVNTLVLRSRPRGELRFVEYLKQVREECLSAFENQDYQFEDLVHRISPPRDMSRNPLFDTMFGALFYDEEVGRFGGVRFSRYEFDYDISKFDLSLTAIEQDQQLMLEFEYCTRLFRRETIERLSAHYLNVLEEVVANPGVKVSDIDVLTAEERRRLVAPPRQPVGGESQKSVVELFQAQVQDPAAPALSFREKNLSYGELDSRSNGLAAVLGERGVARGTLVGVVAAPSLELVIAVLGVLKLGAAYLPLDPKTPLERFRSIVADSGVSTLLIQGDSRSLTAPGLVNILLDEETLFAGDLPVLPPVEPDDLAYVIYTSGSTGTPKGVMVTHGALANYVTWAARTYVGEERVSFALHSSLSVDLTVTSVFVPLVSGNRIVIYQSDDASDLMEEIARDNQVGLIKLTPTHLRLLSEVGRRSGHEASRLRRIIVGGEDLKTDLAAQIHATFKGRVEIFNEYGPTEATVGCAVHKYEPETDKALSVPIGTAIDNTRLFVLDKNGNPVAEGVTGELCVAGVCLATGYLNNPRLTAERFVSGPGPAHLRLYKTGDLARVLPNGELEFLGRNDGQVKIRGFRVELGEIEANLLRLPQVKEAVVTRGVDAAGDAYLCAYIVGDEISTAELRAHLAEHLPEYMIPAWFVPLERLPVGRGGKLDKGALPDPCQSLAGTHAYVAPMSKVEVALASIWEQVLGLQSVGLDDNFFELGGQSLKATLMTARVNRELGARLALRDVFTRPFIRELAALIEGAGREPSTPMEPVAEQEYYPVSSAQKRLYILNQLAPLDVQYNVPWAIEIRGAFDAGRWKQAFCALIARHESLRTSFALVDDEIVQKVHAQVDFAFEAPSSQGAWDLQKEIERFVRPFDLGQAPLLRAAVVRTGESAHTLIVDMHHIVSDGISVEILLDELCLLVRGQTLEPPAIQYKDYAVWQRATAGSERIQAQKAYWTKLLEGEVPVLNLPTDFPRGPVQSFEGDLLRFRVGPATVEGLRGISRTCGATMYMTLLAAYTILLSKYAGQEDIIIGTPIAGRNGALVQRVVGMFANVLVMRNQPRGELTFSEFLSLVRSNALDAYSNQEYQFDELVDNLKIERNLSRNPLFDTVFASLDGGDRKHQVDGQVVELLDFDWKISKFDLTLLVAEREQELDFELEYCARLFHRSTIERFSLHYRHILEQIARNPEQRIADIELLSEAERQQILVEFNRTEHSYPAQQSIHEFFEEQVEQNPGNVAVVCQDTSLSYLELNRRANQIARALLKGGVIHEEVVGIIAGPSIEMIAGILGILKAGCAYLPVDPDCPEQRVRAMLEDSKVRIVLLAGGATWQDRSRLVLDLGAPGIYDGDDSNPGRAVGGGDLAYVIYTSGTTGVPKGVMVEHHSVNNLCAWHIAEFGVTSTDRATKYARFSFDASVWEIFPYLQAGAALHIIEERTRLDLPRLARYFEEKGITIGFLPTQVCELFIDLDNKSLRHLLTGGDRLRRFRPKAYHIVNNYGPTESTVVTTSCELTDEDRIPIGKPVFNTRVYLLGKGDKPVPIGVPGELCIAGVGLARGYVNDAWQTAARFVDNPFEPGEKMYRTGDLARWLPDGSIEFIGRTDKQVKIRGCRTEPREIEATILAHEAVKDAVVVAREDAEHNTFLCAYIVWHEAERAAELHAFLGRQLPDYMVPAFLLTVENLPLNASGKVAIDLLPKPDSSLATGQGSVAPRNETERKLAEIWCRVLDREQISIYDNFFEIGGHSLRATIMLARANREFAADVVLGAVFDNPTIASLAHCFEAVVQHEPTVLKPAKSSLHYSTTPTQKLLYAACTARKGIEYNLPFAFELRGDLDVARLEGAYRQLIRRHEALRTSFRMLGGRVVQTVSPVVDFAIDFLEECDEDEIAEVMRDFIRPFDLARAPLMRVALVPIGSRYHVLLMDIHHLVADGTSMGILFQELAALYAGEDPPLPTVTFKDFAEWLGDHLQGSKLREQEKYWLSVLSNPPPVPRLDTDYPPPASFSFAGARLDFQAGPEIHGALKALCAQQGVTMYMVLLAAYNVLLSKYSGQEDIIVGVPTAGRYIAEVQDVVGMFVSTHAVRCRPQARLRFEDFLQQVKVAVLGTLEHQEFQLWDMMLTHTIKTGGKPLFNTVFVVQDQAFKAMEMSGLDVEEVDPGYNVAKFDLTLGAVERAGRIEFELEYNTDLFRRSRARRFVEHYLNILEQIVLDPTSELWQIELMTRSEKDRILHEFSGGVIEVTTDGTVTQLFERQAQASPDRVALVCDGDSLTYGELNRRSNQLARGLRKEGVEAGDIVGIMVRPSFEMVIGMLAVLKARAAYLPLSREWPQKRIEHFLADGAAKLLLCDQGGDRIQFRTTLVGVGDETNHDPHGLNLGLPADAGALAYVSHTADRAGVPRGVMIEHRSLLDRCRWYAEHFAVTPDDRSAKYGDLSASATIFEVFPFLCAGASICILPEQIEYNAELLARSLEENGVTIAWLPAPLCERLALAENKTLRLLLTSGRNVRVARRGAYEIVQCFGPAAATEAITCRGVGSEGTEAIAGKPIRNTQVYILGHDGGLLPIGVTGELCVGGIGLARGYLGDDEATRSRFVPDPHAVGGRMYRTGVAARWLSGGDIELTGHLQEVSIDGHRVCLAEIERHLEAHRSIAEAVVVFDDSDPLHQRLVAFIVTPGGLPLPPQPFVHELKSHLAQWLPGTMIPDNYVKVGMIPRDADGRVQYGLLPIPGHQAGSAEPMAPWPAAADNVQAIVEDLLGGQQIGAAAGLRELGLDSLLAMSLVARLADAFGGAASVGPALATSTVSEVARCLAEVLRGTDPGYVAPEQGSRPS